MDKKIVKSKVVKNNILIKDYVSGILKDLDRVFKDAKLASPTQIFFNLGSDDGMHMNLESYNRVKFTTSRKDKL